MMRDGTDAPRTFVVVLAGLAAFLDLYATQPLLPLLARVFHATRFAVSLTVTATTVGVAIAAPGAGWLANRAGLRRVVVGSAAALAGATLLAATATTLPVLILWRFVQGAVTPGLFATTVAYIHEEWPPARTGRATAAYVSGTVVGGVTGRLVGGLAASRFGWPSAFVVLSALGFTAAAALWRWLPAERRVRAGRDARLAERRRLRTPQLLATYGVGFLMLCTQVAMFTYVPFVLAAPPFSLSTGALGSIFLTYLVGAVITPFAGIGIDAYGHRRVLMSAVGLCAAGSVLTLAPSLPAVIAGLSLFASGVFFGQAASSSHVARHAGADRTIAIGIYTTAYYVGGSVGGAVPSVLWTLGRWPACVAFILAIEAAMLAIAWRFWEAPLVEAGISLY